VKQPSYDWVLFDLDETLLDFPVAEALARTLTIYGVEADDAAMALEDARAMGCYGALCATGQGVEKDLNEAYRWFLQAANRGDVPAQVALGLCLAEGLGAPMNRTEAANWLYRAGMAGNRRAIEALEALTMKDCSAIGPLFTEAELIHFLYTFKKARGHQRSVLECRGETE